MQQIFNNDYSLAVPKKEFHPRHLVPFPSNMNDIIIIISSLYHRINLINIIVAIVMIEMTLFLQMRGWNSFCIPVNISEIAGHSQGPMHGMFL